VRRRLRTETQEHADTVLRLQAPELHDTAPFAPGDDRFVAELASPGLGACSFVLGPQGTPPPAWIVLDYADGQQRRWRRAGGRHFFTLAEDTASTGYITTVA
jgi:hypothetical protein